MAEFIEPDITEKFKPVSADKINLVLNAYFEDYHFNDIQIQK